MILTHGAPSSTDMTFKTLMKAPSEGSMSVQSISCCLPPKMLVVLCDTIRKHLIPTSVTVKAGDDPIKFLTLSVMGLVESLCWNIPEALGERPHSFHAIILLTRRERLGLIPRSPQVLTILLDALQPPWLLCRSVRLLVIPSTRKPYCRLTTCDEKS